MDLEPRSGICPEKRARDRLLKLAETHPEWVEQIWLRFVRGRPVSALTTEFLAWSCGRLEERGKRALFLIWDNAGWHTSHAVQKWIRAHNRAVRRSGQGVRIVVCALPSRSPWLNPFEPHRMHGKRAVAEPDALLTADELERRVCAHFGFDMEPHHGNRGRHGTLESAR